MHWCVFETELNNMVILIIVMIIIVIMTVIVFNIIIIITAFVKSTLYINIPLHFT